MSTIRIKHDYGSSGSYGLEECKTIGYSRRKDNVGSKLCGYTNIEINSFNYGIMKLSDACKPLADYDEECLNCKYTTRENEIKGSTY